MASVEAYFSMISGEALELNGSIRFYPEVRDQVLNSSGCSVIGLEPPLWTAREEVFPLAKCPSMSS